MLWKQALISVNKVSILLFYEWFHLKVLSVIIKIMGAELQRQQEQLKNLNCNDFHIIDNHASHWEGTAKALQELLEDW